MPLTTNPAATTRRGIFAAIGSVLPVLIAPCLIAHGQEKSGFPDGYDAVQAAPDTHKVIFENNFVRVLQVTVPPPGTTIPMHHHRWHSFFLDWDVAGGMPHIRYHRPDGSVRDSPGKEESVHPGTWRVQWMKPEPMHVIEVVSTESAAGILEGPKVFGSRLNVIHCCDLCARRKGARFMPLLRSYRTWNPPF